MISYHIKRALEKDAEKIKELSSKLVVALDSDDVKEINSCCRKLRVVHSDLNATILTLSLYERSEEE